MTSPSALPGIYNESFRAMYEKEIVDDIFKNKTELYPNITTLFDPNMATFRRAVHLLDMYLVPVLVAVGILGNLLSFMVFMGTYLRKMSSSIYLAGLAISDSVFLLTVFLSWADNIGVHVYHKPGWCQLLVYLTYVSSFLSVWYVVAFTVERYLAIRFPLKRQQMCTASRAKKVVIGLAVLAGVLYSFAFWTAQVTENRLYRRLFCAIVPRYFHLVMNISNVDAFITLILPTILIVGSNGRIAVTLAEFYRHLHSQLARPHSEVTPRDSSVQLQSLLPRGTRTPCKTTATTTTLQPMADQLHLTNSQEATSSTTVKISHTANGRDDLFIDSSYNRLQMKVTKMLLIISTVFLICNIPGHALRVYLYFVTLINEKTRPSHKILLVQKVFQFLYYFNFAANFFLYSLSGQTFRRGLVRLCVCAKQRTHSGIRRLYSAIRLRTKRHTRTDVLVHLRGSDESYN